MATSSNFGTMFSMVGASLFLSFLPLFPKQILLMNLMTDMPEMTIATDNVDEELVEKPRRWNIKFIRKFMIVFDKVAQTIANGKKDKQSLRKPAKLQGEWNLNSSKGYQFRIELSYEKGKEVIEIDSPSFLGGNGKRLGPMAYCVAGITSCFIVVLQVLDKPRSKADQACRQYGMHD